MLALLLKMEAAFFTGNAQMEEADLSSLSSLIIGSSGCLVLLWIVSVFGDCYKAKKKRKRERFAEEEARKRRQRFKRSTNLLKAGILKKKMFSSMKDGGSGFSTSTTSKIKKKSKTNEKRMVLGLLASASAAPSSASAAEKKSKQPVNFVTKFMKKKPGTALMAEVRAEFGPGSKVYSAMVTLVAELQKRDTGAAGGATTSVEIQKRLDSCLAAAGGSTPVVSEDKRMKYLDFLLQIAGVSSETTTSFMPSSMESNSAKKIPAPPKVAPPQRFAPPLQ